MHGWWRSAGGKRRRAGMCATCWPARASVLRRARELSTGMCMRWSAPEQRKDVRLAVCGARRRAGLTVRPWRLWSSRLLRIRVVHQGDGKLVHLSAKVRLCASSSKLCDCTSYVSLLYVLYLLDDKSPQLLLYIKKGGACLLLVPIAVRHVGIHNDEAEHRSKESKREAVRHEALLHRQDKLRGTHTHRLSRTRSSLHTAA